MRTFVGMAIDLSHLTDEELSGLERLAVIATVAKQDGRPRLSIAKIRTASDETIRALADLLEPAE